MMKQQIEKNFAVIAECDEENYSAEKEKAQLPNHKTKIVNKKPEEKKNIVPEPPKGHKMVRN